MFAKNLPTSAERWFWCNCTNRDCKDISWYLPQCGIACTSHLPPIKNLKVFCSNWNQLILQIPISRAVRVKSWCWRSQTIKPRDLLTSERPVMAICEGMCSVLHARSPAHLDGLQRCSPAPSTHTPAGLLESWSLDLLHGRLLEGDWDLGGRSESDKRSWTAGGRLEFGRMKWRTTVEGDWDLGGRSDKRESGELATMTE
jgi:hypothetical protein